MSDSEGARSRKFVDRARERRDTILRDQMSYRRGLVCSMRWAAALAGFGLAAVTGCSSEEDPPGPAAPADAYAETSHAVDSGVDESPPPEASPGRAYG